MGFDQPGVGVGWLLVTVGIVVIGWGVFAVGFSAGIPPFNQMSLVSIPTPMGSVSIDDRQFAGGALLVVLGLIIISVGVALLRQGKHGIL
jgi:hypothetical protein